ncbi:MAG: hypothetical protein HUK19_06725 [Fibrobacter sp.]|nr:hypothetical protein [Fibrobacter sp.]
MKRILIVAALLVAIGLGFVIFLTFATSDKQNLDEMKTSKTELSLYAVADSANMLRATSVGLGKRERHRMISGRLYENFVQLLKTNGRLEEQEHFTDDCKEGLVLEFYRDTVLLDEFRMTNRIGRDSAAGVWKTRHMAKVNKFLKDQAVQFMACPVTDGGDSFADSLLLGSEKRRTILTMPQFGVARKSRRNAERESMGDSLAGAASDLSKPDSSVISESQNALRLLDELIFPADTAVGKPLKMYFEQMNKGSVSFYNEDGSEKKEQFVTLTNSQMKLLGELFEQTRLETFVMNELEDRKVYSEITLYENNRESVCLWKLSEKSNYLVKIHKDGRSHHFEGYWVPKDPAALQGFFDGLK